VTVPSNCYVPLVASRERIRRMGTFLRQKDEGIEVE
jgi:hypothetical protein